MDLERARADEELERSHSCVLACHGRPGPLLVPMACWYDGERLWMTTAAISVKARVLARDPDCALVAPAVDGGDRVVAYGRARVYGPADPVGLAVHAPVVAAAMSVLVARSPRGLGGHLRDAPLVPLEWALRRRVALRVAVDSAHRVTVPPLGAGVAPALPPAVPPDVRRAVAGRRRVTVGWRRPGGGLGMTPGVWGAGFSLTTLEPLPSGVGVTAVLDADHRDGSTPVCGLAVRGIAADGGLRPERVTWWQGFRARSATVRPVTGGVELPD